MRVGIRRIAGIALSAALISPVAALAVTEDEVVVVVEEPVIEEPVVEEPVVEEPVVEEPVVENPIDNPENGKRTREKEKPPVVVTKRPKVTEPEVKVYKYSSKTHFCAAGLQPVTVSGSVSCGKPNQSRTYQQMMAHPTPVVKRKKVRTYHRSAVPICRPGTKGCSDR